MNYAMAIRDEEYPPSATSPVLLVPEDAVRPYAWWASRHDSVAPLWRGPNSTSTNVPELLLPGNLDGSPSWDIGSMCGWLGESSTGWIDIMPAALHDVGQYWVMFMLGASAAASAFFPDLQVADPDKVIGFLRRHTHALSAVRGAADEIRSVVGEALISIGLGYVIEPDADVEYVVVDVTADASPEHCLAWMLQFDAAGWLDESYEVRRDVSVVVRPR